MKARLHFITLFLLVSQPIESYANNAKITFTQACAPGPSILIAAVGDVLLHLPLQEAADQQGFESLWNVAIPYIKTADIGYANLEGPMAQGMKRSGDDRVYSSFPYFNYRPGLAKALKNTGFDIVSTANNHILDRFSEGIDKTLKALDEAGLAHAGTRPRGSQQTWLYILNKKNFKIAFIACTEMTNDNPDDYKQVLYCYKKSHRAWILNTITNIKHQVDAVIILPHWGEEYHHHPNADQIEFAHQVLDAGATAVIGSHPHVLQPLQKYITKDNRETLIMFSMGNFVSNQYAPDERSTIILFLGLTKTPQGTFINGVRFLPMYMQNRSGRQNIHLTPLSQDQASLQQTIEQSMPMGNAIYGLPIVTNPQCFKESR